MKINNISCSPSFNAILSKGVQKMITKARQVCTEQERPLVEDAVKTLNECCPNLVLATQKKATHILVPSTQKGNLWGYFYGVKNSRSIGEPVFDLRNAAAGLEWMHIGGVKMITLFGEKPRLTNTTMIKDIDGRFSAYYKKWMNFFNENGSKLPPLK